MPQAVGLPKQPAPGITTPFDPHNAPTRLQNSPVRVVDPSLLDQFAATDVPLFILTDPHGIVRVIQPVDEGAISPGSTIDSAISCIGSRFRLPSPKPVFAPTT